MFFKYTLPRLIRRFIPTPIFRLMLHQQWFLLSGAETRIPRFAFERYQRTVLAAGHTLQGKRVMVFGYGGTYVLGCMLLQAGAAHVVLCDKYTSPDDYYNKNLLPEFSQYLTQNAGRIAPKPEYLTVLRMDVCELAESADFRPVDLIFSSSVLEHLDDVDHTIQALAAITHPDGLNLHFINLQDHLFRYPFQMLTYSEESWRKWLNPPSNLNRFRVPAYLSVFEKHFGHVDSAITQRDLKAFEQIRPDILPEFLTGDDQVDSATRLQVLASQPRWGTPPHQAAPLE
ncbi:MAG: methyltransferase domain-containing protein [Chloroflexota bacterium]